jgi:hypothetical protein
VEKEEHRMEKNQIGQMLRWLICKLGNLVGWSSISFKEIGSDRI